MNDPNVIYYTFSTIPQVLAGAIALVGVFALYKLREIREDIKGYAQNFYNNCKDIGILFIEKDEVKKFHKNFIGRMYGKLLSDFDEIIEIAKKKKVNIEGFITEKDLYAERFPKLSKIKCITIFTAVITAIIIIASIIIIPYASVISQLSWLNWFLLIAFLLVGFNLFLMVLIIITCL